MRHLEDLVIFAEVAERGSFTAAARALSLPKSRVSHRVAALEADVGVQLMQRSTRRLSLTPAGEAFLRHCVALRDAARAADEWRMQAGAEPRGIVRLSCPVTLAQGGVGQLLPRFLARYPEVDVHMRVMNRPVDPIEEGVDIVLRVRDEIEASTSLAARRFGLTRALLLGSPELLRRHPSVRTPEDLASLPTVAMSLDAGAAGLRLGRADGTSFRFVHTPRYVADDLSTLRFAILAGVGIGMLPDYLCREERRLGTLVEVLPEWQLPPGIAHAMYPPRRAHNPAVRALLDFLEANLIGEEPLAADAAEHG
ncbi:LysR family transcriptional regulator [Verticiella sediminum]|uniref:LysR family transcriptional regulator n=1 Tax=Verticiella sediminum TaxID=1247510 RepID=A0A556AB33_9BURK|nr:LysR family transcriptional regulator [Verticiella sediminum]TSH90077.1 LysR family transcriptional regulator [Verticiella sediminum]